MPLPPQGDHVLVYVTSPAPELAKLLASVRCRFIAYGFGREGKNEQGNILYKKPSIDGFFADLTSARAIVANSGFSLVTEALHLGKPYLAVPVSHQFEQIFNAYWLEKSGYGAYWEELNKVRRRVFPLQSPALSRSAGTISPTRQRRPPRKTRHPDRRLHRRLTYKEQVLASRRD